MEHITEIIWWLVQVVAIISGTISTIFFVFMKIGVFPKELKLVFGRIMLVYALFSIGLTIWFFRNQPPFIKSPTADDIYKQMMRNR